MAKILELHPAQVRNTLTGYHPPENRKFYSKWFDSSGNNNHGVLNSELYYFDSRGGWLGSWDFNNYWHLYTGLNGSYLAIPTLNTTNFPQAEGTILFNINVTEWTNINQAMIFGSFGNQNIFCRVNQTGSEYGLQTGFIGSDGVYKAVIGFADAATNRITIGVITKIALKYKTGAGGYFALFINGVKVKQVSISNTETPINQLCNLGGSSYTDRKRYYYLMIDNTALADQSIIDIQNADQKIPEYTLPSLNKTYVAIGDSITWACASGLNYPNLLHAYVKNTYGKMQYLNKGIGGEWGGEAVTNLPWTALCADIVTIALGMNDCAGGGSGTALYKTNLETIIDYLRVRNPDVKIILCTPSGTSDANRTPYIASYRTAMQEVATAKNTYICNFHEAVTDANIGSYSSDSIHPNTAGHVLLMAKLQPIIDEILS